MPVDGYQYPVRETSACVAECRVVRRAESLAEPALECLHGSYSRAAGTAGKDLAEKSPENDRDREDTVASALGPG